MSEEIRKTGFFTDENGNKSSMRLMSFIGFISIIGVFVGASIAKKMMVPIGYEHVLLLLTCLAPKTVQSYIEKMK